MGVGAGAWRKGRFLLFASWRGRLGRTPLLWSHHMGRTPQLILHPSKTDCFLRLIYVQHVTLPHPLPLVLPVGQGRGSTHPTGQYELAGHGPEQAEEGKPRAAPNLPAGQKCKRPLLAYFPLGAITCAVRVYVQLGLATSLPSTVAQTV